MRRTTVVLIVAAILVLGTAAALIAIRPDDEPEVIGGPPPSVHTIRVDVVDFHFRRRVFHAPPGINTILFRSREGSHTLVFAAPEFRYVQLAQPGGNDRARVELKAGHRYRIFDTLPGHRAAGEHATIVVDRPAVAAP